MIVIVPSRGRPQNIAQLRTAFNETATGQPRLVLAVDNDDPRLAEYLALGEETIVGDPTRLGPWLNLLGPRLAEDDGVVGFMGDDHRPRTNGWDQKIELAMTRSPRIVYGNDLIQGPNLPTAVFMSSQIITTLGYMLPPGLIHLFIDNAWKAWGDRADCLTYLNDVVIEHCHPIAQKGVEWDEGYTNANNQAVESADSETFKAYCGRGQLDLDVAKIRGI